MAQKSQLNTLLDIVTMMSLDTLLKLPQMIGYCMIGNALIVTRERLSSLLIKSYWKCILKDDRERERERERERVKGAF